jgi:acyl carrier protein
MRDSIRKFIEDELLNLGENDEIDAAQDLLADDLVDSLGMIRLLAFIQDEFDYAVPEVDFLIENFQTLDAIVAYLERSMAKMP